MSDVQELNINNSTYDIKAKSVVDTNSGKVKFWTGTQAEYDAITTKDADTLYNVTDTDPSYSVNTQYKNIGAIVQSAVPLTDAGLHLLDGSLIQMGVYSEFVEYMANLYGDGTNIPSYFCTESEWQTSVSTYGSCGKFVYDSVNNTVRLPKITGIVEGTTDATALGDLVEAGLPNITGRFAGQGNRTAFQAASGAFYKSGGISGSGAADKYDDSCQIAVELDASRSSSIYGNSSTVQPQTIKVLYYIVIANSTKTEIQSDIDEVVTDLNGKADTDLTNVTDTGYIKMAGAGMPSNRYIDLTLGASGTQYTAPANGYFSILARSASTVRFDGLKYNVTMPNVSSSLSAIIFPILKGKTVTLLYGTLDLSDSWNYFRFIYAVGSESEAQ